MNRRDFLKAVPLAASIPAITITCKYKDDEKGPEKESSNWKRWITESTATRESKVSGHLVKTSEAALLEEDLGWPYAGWMDQGKLHFASLDDATDFVDMHVRAKDDTNLIDSIYDIYFVSRKDPEREAEIKVAHYWFNGDTGRTVVWEQDGFNRKTGEGLTDWTKVESA